MATCRSAEDGGFIEHVFERVPWQGGVKGAVACERLINEVHSDVLLVRAGLANTKRGLERGGDCLGALSG